MAKYIINAPDKQSVTISCNYGNMTLKHGEESYNDNLAVIFPQLFIKVQETKFEQTVIEPVIDLKDKIVEVVQEVIEEVKEFISGDENKEVEPTIIEEPVISEPTVEETTEVVEETEEVKEEHAHKNNHKNKKK